MASKNEYSGYLKSTGRIMAPGQGIFEESSSAKANLGDRIAFADGRVYRYAKAGATALAAGKFVKAGALVAQIVKLATAVAVGNNTVTLATTSAITTANDGYLQIDTGTGVGMQYKIKTCAANATTATSTDFVLYDGLSVALDATSYGSVFYNPYEQCEIVAALTDIVLGVPPVAVTAEYYFWLQTWGLACVLSEGTPTAGHTVVVGLSGNIGGTTNILPITATGAGTSRLATQIVGTQWQVGVVGIYKMVNLMLMP
jgi:hypothetical protein